jgi:hypothetical protein
MVMKLALLAVCVGAFLAAPGIAAADPPQGKLTGSAHVNGGTFAITTTVTDGGTSYVGLENDLSGNCNGDSGTVIFSATTFSVVCAHFVLHSGCCLAGSPKMRFAINVGTPPAVPYRVFRITDNGASTDTEAVAFADSLATAQSMVNTGVVGSGYTFSAWTFGTVTSGDYTVTP